jgi:hypothetical protein
VVDEAVKLTEAMVQLKFPTGAIARFGGVSSCMIVTESFFIQPVVLLVTVTKYFPGVVTVTGFCPIAKPVQVKEVFAVIEEALRLTEVLIRVSTPTGAIVKSGGAIFCVTMAVSIDTHPLTGSVTVTV